jgi:hypothetical protein
MKERVRFFGLDALTRMIAVAVAEQDGEVRILGRSARGFVKPDC